MITVIRCMACRSQLGRVDTEALHRPLTPDQILPIKDGSPACFHEKLGDWRKWFCPVCMRKPVREDMVFTDIGEVEVPFRVEPVLNVEPVYEPDVTVQEFPKAVIVQAAVNPNECPHCKKDCGSPIGLRSHIRHKHKEK